MVFFKNFSPMLFAYIKKDSNGIKLTPLPNLSEVSKKQAMSFTYLTESQKLYKKID